MNLWWKKKTTVVDPCLPSPHSTKPCRFSVPKKQHKCCHSCMACLRICYLRSLQYKYHWMSNITQENSQEFYLNSRRAHYTAEPLPFDMSLPSGKIPGWSTAQRFRLNSYNSFVFYDFL